MCAVCGNDATISVDDSEQTNAHIFNISSSAPGEDVRTFDSGDYGAFVNCIREGTIDISTYTPISGLAPGGTADIVANVAGQDTVTLSNVVCVSKDVSVDAKSIVNWDYSFRITGTVTGDW